MSSIVKTKLKAVREAVAKKDYVKARDASLSVLDYEPENYLAHVVLGSAYLELGDLEQSEQMCLKATTIQPEVSTAWQGLVKVYEHTENWEKYLQVIDKLSKIFLKSNDANKCAETLQKLIEYRRKNGTPMELADALSLLLPGSPYYTLLSELPPPDATNPTATTTFDAQSAIHNSLPILEEIVSIIETHENDVFTREVAKRRTRLGVTGPEAVQREVGREIWSISRLPSLYQEILSHPNASDDLRRATEAKLLQHKQQLLYALTSKDDLEAKKALSAEVQELVGGIVLLNIPNELAWNLNIEGTNASSIEEYDLDVLFRYVRLFPNAPLAKLLSAYFSYSHITDTEPDDGNSDSPHRDDEDDFAAIILGALNDASNSILAHRIAAQVYQDEEDLENAVRTAENGLSLVLREERDRAISLSRARFGLNIILGTSLVHLFPPKHHTRALRIIDEVLSEDSKNVRCLMGRGFILQHAKNWSEARSQFSSVVKLLPDDTHDGLRSREEAAWCQAQDQDPYDATQELQEVLSTLDTLEGREFDQARCWWRLGKCRWDLGDKSSREAAYKSFITSLKRFSTYAPAFTSLGIYYSDFCSPPDPTRASKCFQKAFELDPREADAARRLAEGFAEERDWDLVEVVARRTIQGEGGSDNSSASRFQPVNAWAWKAVGIVELTRHRYSAAISSLQVALRSHPEDPLLWLRLGEAYVKAARLAAAHKALERARELDPSEWKCSYFLGEVFRQSGQYQQAIDIFSDILLEEPSELAVLVSLSQTHLEFGKAEKVGGFTARAESSFISSIRVVLEGLDASPGFRRIAWKTAADALFEASQLSSYSEDQALVKLINKALPLVTAHPMEQLTPLVSIPPRLSERSHSALSRFILEACLCAYSYRISLGSLDSSASASALYDLGVALRLYYQRSNDDEKREKINDESVRCFKEAISLSPGDDRYWSTLGSALFTSKPRLAQHAYVKALDIDAKNFITWTNLGLFYLYHSDAELAKEAFNRAQVLDPDYATAWVGQAILAATLGHQSEASALFEHAIGLTATVPDADIAYARRSLSALNSSSQQSASSPELLFPAFFVLDRYCKQRPEDATGLHLFGLVCEQVGHLDLGIVCIEKVVSLLEAAYEESEDPTIERQFTIAHINMARLRLSSSAYEEALESYQTAIGLLAEPEDQSSSLLLAQAHLGSGIAHLAMEDAEAAIGAFESALAAASTDQRLKDNAVVLLAQTLWSLGTEEAQEAAKTHLLQSIENNPDNLIAVNTLAGMGILTDDDSLLDAALSEILGLPIHERHERDPERDVTYLLMQHHLGQNNVREAVSVAQRALVYEPTRSKAREDLARLSLQQQEAVSANAILQSSSIEPRDSLALRAISEACLGFSSAKSCAAKAVFRTPWEERNWQALAYCCSVQRAG